MVRSDALRVKLHAMHRRRDVPDPLNRTLVAPRTSNKRIGQIDQGQRVITNGSHGRGQARKQANLIVSDIPRFAVNRRDPRKSRAACQADRLLTQAHAQQGSARGDACSGKFDAYASICWVPGSRREEDAAVPPAYRFSHAESVALHHVHYRTQSQAVINQSEGEAVVIVDHQQPWSRHDSALVS